MSFEFIAVSLLLKLELSHCELLAPLFMGLAPEPFGCVLVRQVPLSFLALWYGEMAPVCPEHFLSQTWEKTFSQ